MGEEKIIEIKNKAKLIALCKALKEGKSITNLVVHSCNGLYWEGEFILTFDVCRCGNAKHNVTVIIRDMMKKEYPGEEFTYKMVASLLWCGAERRIEIF